MIPLIVVIVAGLIVAAFAAAAETSLTSVSRIRMRSLADDGNRRARTVTRLHADPNAYLSTILTLNTVAVIVVSTATALLVDTYLNKVPQAVGTIVLSIIVLIFCEIAPKSLALRFNERFALALAGPVRVLTSVLRPLVGGLSAFSRLIVRVATKGHSVRGPFVTEEELKLLLYVGEQEGIVEQEEREMIHGILEMTDKSVREVMVPRVDVVAAENTDTIADVIRLIIEHGYSRIPIYEDSIDNIVGVVYAKDLLRHGVVGDDQRALTEVQACRRAPARDEGAQGAYRRGRRRARRHRGDRDLRGPDRGDRRPDPRRVRHARGRGAADRVRSRGGGQRTLPR
jgi:CBS domain containing-hemolysin-like protein